MNLSSKWASVLAGIKSPHEAPSALWTQVHTQNLLQKLCCSHHRSSLKYEEMEKEAHLRVGLNPIQTPNRLHLPSPHPPTLPTVLQRDSEHAPQDVSNWYVNSFELKATETLQAQEKHFPFPLRI